MMWRGVTRGVAAKKTQAARGGIKKSARLWRSSGGEVPLDYQQHPVGGTQVPLTAYIQGPCQLNNIALNQGLTVDFRGCAGGRAGRSVANE